MIGVERDEYSGRGCLQDLVSMILSGSRERFMANRGEWEDTGDNESGGREAERRVLMRQSRTSEKYRKA